MNDMRLMEYMTSMPVMCFMRFTKVITIVVA